MPNTKKRNSSGKRVTRYEYNDVKEPRTPETGHTPLLPADEQVVTLPMDNGWTKAVQVGRLPENGSIFFQIGEENAHLVRGVLDEVFGKASCVTQIVVRKTTGATSRYLPPVCDYVLWYAKDIERVKFRQLYLKKEAGQEGAAHCSYVELPNGDRRALTREEKEDLSLLPSGSRLFTPDNLQSASVGREKGEGAACWFPVKIGKREFLPNPKNRWKTNEDGMARLVAAGRVFPQDSALRYIRYLDDFPAYPLTNVWTDVGGAADRVYVVQTNTKIVSRCLLMSTDPGDLAFDPTCGSGTTAFCAETFGRRWITCDTSRVAVNVARQRLLSSILPHYKTRNGAASSGFVCQAVGRITLKSIAYGQEPEKVELVDQPDVEKDAVRICGPFEVMTLRRYSAEDWKGSVVREAPTAYGEPAKLENYIGVICRLYRKDAAIQGANGLVHAIAELEKEKIAISIGPLTGRVTAKQINDAVQDALASGILEVHVLGWAFEANVGEIKSQLEKRGKVKVELIMIRPDTLAERLKATQPEMLFSPLALPDVKVAFTNGNGPSTGSGRGNGKAKQAVVTLDGVGVFDRKKRTTDCYRADSGYVAACYLDEDYDGDCFVDCQMFFDFKKAPNIKAALKAEVDPDEFKLQLTPQPFPVRGYKRIAVKVVDVYGNESTVVKDLNP